MKKLRILTVGVGGQGILLFSKILGEACLRADIPVTMSEVHGMAQRGGVVETNIVLGGIKSPLIAKGEADVLVGLEPVETLRALPRASKNTVIISSTDPVVPQIVKDGLAEYPELSPLFEKLKRAFEKVYLFPGEKLAKEAGTSRALNVVTLGALIGTGILPFDNEDMIEAIKKAVKPQFLEPNLKAFDLGYQAVTS
ncbi:Indolepyruvate ferredoxin oxidoreductase [Thermodesulfatator indicus DSM 15286]|uniref:Indolepyruvate ferredoxin oxidoreductase n=1 Tax=Thermodesulfatator indicus (strain DSM 15286 / JCM 11887 / CIR29812) TaxID=667014 RepID=F8AE40_THEID|nr:indolepyruvate oxidoreductase subunit beta [Thermodesulfatator indicus]AEH43979.1 Indolepyruvate ferredoxin oxidoreductase [Thermodesulfatator indicus DSM 15286]